MLILKPFFLCVLVHFSHSFVVFIFANKIVPFVDHRLAKKKWNKRRNQTPQQMIMMKIKKQTFLRMHSIMNAEIVFKVYNRFKEMLHDTESNEMNENVKYQNMLQFASTQHTIMWWNDRNQHFAVTNFHRTILFSFFSYHF